MGFEWKKEYSVNVKEIDEQHKVLVAIINELNTAIESRSLNGKLKGILEKLLIYGSTHFSTEENYFKKFKYSDAKTHIDEHKKFKKKVQQFKEKYENNEMELSFELIDFLEDWLLDHIMNCDKKYMKCFNDHGLL